MHIESTSSNVTYQSTKKIQEDEESHREAAETKQLRKENELAQVMDSRVDPPTTLRQQHPPRLRGDRMRQGIRIELGAERREVLEHQSRKVTIFTEGEQVLLVQGVDVRLGVLFDDAVGNDDRTSLVCCTDTVHGETTGQTGH